MTGGEDRRAHFRTAEDRDRRDEKLREWVRDEHAIEWLLMYFDVFNIVDDFLDRDSSVSTADAGRCLMRSLVEMPINPFFDAHKAQLTAVVLTGINAWLDSEEKKQVMKNGDGQAAVDAYCLRGYAFEVLLFAVACTRGVGVMRALSMEIRHFFFYETYSDYQARHGVS